MKRRGPECMDEMMAWKKEELLRGEKAGEGEYGEAGHLTVLATVAEREDLPVYSHHPLKHSKKYSTVQSQCPSIRVILSSCPPYNTPLQTAPRYPLNHTTPPLYNPQQRARSYNHPSISSNPFTLNSLTRKIVYLCLLRTVFTLLFLLFVFTLDLIGSASVPKTLARHSKTRSSTHGAPLSV